MLSSGNDESYHDVNNEARMRNDGQIIGSGFHNTEERQGLGQVTLDSDVCLKYLFIVIRILDLCEI